MEVSCFKREGVEEERERKQQTNTNNNIYNTFEFLRLAELNTRALGLRVSE